MAASIIWTRPTTPSRASVPSPPTPSPPRRRAFSNLAEFRGGRTPARSKVVPGHCGQPRARGKARTREREPQHPFKGQSFHGAYCHFDAQAGDVNTRWSNDLHYPDPGRVVSRRRVRPAAAGRTPPTRLRHVAHVLLTQEAGGRTLRDPDALWETVRPPVDHRCVKTNDHAVAAGHSVDPARWQEAFEGLMSRIAGRFTRVEPRRRARQLVLGLLSDLPRKNCWTIAEWAEKPARTACSICWGGPSGTPTGSATMCVTTWWTTCTTTRRYWWLTNPGT